MILTRLTILGAPRTKKNSPRIVRAGRRQVLLPSRAYVAYEQSALWQIRRAWGRRPPITQTVQVAALFYRERQVGDLDNYLHAIGDILQKAGVLINDKQIKSWDGARLLRDCDNPRVEVTIAPF